MENALKIFSVIMVIIVVAAAISMLPEQVDNFVGQESDVSEASYIIYKDGDYTCAKNGTTGRIDVRNENTSHVLQYAVNQGGVVYLSAGNYELSYHVNMTTGNTTLMGAGSSTILTCTSSMSDLAALEVGDWFSNSIGMRIQNLVIDGAGYASPGIYLNKVIGADVSGCVIKNIPTRSGISLHDVNYCTIENNIINGIGGTTRYGNGIAAGSRFSYNGSNYNIIRGNTISATTLSGIDIEPGSYNLITENIIYDLRYYNSTKAVGILVGASFAHCSDNVISNNVITGYQNNIIQIMYSCNNSVIGNHLKTALQAGIYVGLQSNSTVISGNTIQNCLNGGIIIDRSCRAIITDNRVYDCNPGAGTISGISILSSDINNPANFTVVNGNIVSGCYRGIKSTGTYSGYNIVTANMCKGNAAAISLVGTGNVNANNVDYNA